MKRKVFLIITISAFVFCCIQAVKVECIENKETTFEEKEIVLYDELKIKNIVVDTPESVNLEECSLANETPIIAQLANSNELNRKDLKNIGQAIVYVEMRYLGCSNPPLLEVGYYDHSYYDNEQNVIYLSEDEEMNDYKDFIIRILHLCYHVYQYKQIEMFQLLESTNGDYSNLLIMLDARYWNEEKDIYNGCCKENEELWMEKDAEKYALGDYREYVDSIEGYWNGFQEEMINDFIEHSDAYTL